MIFLMRVTIEKKNVNSRKKGAALFGILHLYTACDANFGSVFTPLSALLTQCHFVPDLIMYQTGIMLIPVGCFSVKELQTPKHPDQISRYYED